MEAQLLLELVQSNRSVQEATNIVADWANQSLGCSTFALLCHTVVSPITPRCAHLQLLDALLHFWQNENSAIFRSVSAHLLQACMLGQMVLLMQPDYDNSAGFHSVPDHLLQACMLGQVLLLMH